MEKPNSTWQGLKLSLVMVATGALIAACGGSDDPVTTTAMCDSEFQTVLNAVPAPDAGGGGGGGGEQTTFTVHYKRNDANYDGWQIHTWGIGQDPGWNNGHNSTGTDSFGAIYKVPLTAATGNLGYTLHKGDDKDHGGADQSFNVDGTTYEIWRKEGDSVTYTSNPDAAATPDITTVKVHYKRYDNAYSNWGLHMWDGSGINTGALAGVTINDWANPVAFSAMPAYAAGQGEVVFNIPVNNPKDMTTPGTGFEFIIHGTGDNTGDKDGWTDNVKVSYAAMTINNQVGEIWLVQQTPTVYYGEPDLRSVDTTDAKAYWLNKSLIKWPKVDTSGSFKLYYSATGQIKAAKDGAVTGADGSLDLEVFTGTVPTDVATRFKYVAPGVVLSVKADDIAKLADLKLHTNQLVVVQATDAGVQNATTAQIAGALDDMYAAAGSATLGVTVAAAKTDFALWAPTAKKVSVCVYDNGTGKSTEQIDMTFDTATGVWKASKDADLSGKYYKFAVDVFVRGVGVVRNLVTDPYSVSLTTDSARSYIADLNSDSLKPEGWDAHTAPALAAQEDMAIYELHVRDFSINDETVNAANRGKYLAFTEENSNGMKHLKALANAGLTDVHLLPVFDIGTIPEADCAVPAIVSTATDSDVAKKAIEPIRDKDCFNWGYDPFHYTALEGSYSSNPGDGAARVKEFRQLVMSLHEAGLRVGLDVVYNHTHAAGQDKTSVLDRIVPGYYQRLNATGVIERSTCCTNTATENLMMGKLMHDSVITLAKEYKLDSFRFDLMGHQPKAAMVNLKNALFDQLGRNVELIGEGWNFGEVANGARFEQASQLSLNGTGIATFSDRARDRIRGGGCCDDGAAFKQQGFATGLYLDPNASASGHTLDSLLDHADIVRVGLAGSIRDYSFITRDGSLKQAQELKYGSDPAGYVTDPQEVVNYVENHDNRTLFDALVAKLPVATSVDDRIRVQNLALALGGGYAQGVAYFHAGGDILRSKSMDNNSYNSGDWFNRLDWTYATNNWGVGLPVEGNQDLAKEFLAPTVAAALTPTQAQIQAASNMFLDMLKIRKSSNLFRMRAAADIKNRLKFHNTGAAQVPGVIVMELVGDSDDNGVVDQEGMNFKRIVVAFNVDKKVNNVTVGSLANKALALHPVLQASSDAVVKTATFNATTGAMAIPARSSVVWVE